MATLNEEIGKLIANRLLQGDRVALPSVGSLRIERRPARQLSATRVEPPYRFVEFASAEEGVMLTEEIARVAGCEAALAEDACRRWLARNYDTTTSTLTIEGVGQLTQKSFRMDEAFARRLNPQGRQPVKVRRRSMPWWLWCSVTLLTIFLLFGALALWFDPLPLWSRFAGSDNGPAEGSLPAAVSEEPFLTARPEKPAAEPETAAPAAGDPLPAPDTEAPADPHPAAKPMMPRQTPPDDPEAISRTESGKSYIVLGIFSTETNARRAVAAASETAGAKGLVFRIFRYGEKYLVSPGVYESRDEAQQAALLCRRQLGREDLWVYSKN